MVNFQHFANIKKAINSNNFFFFKYIYINFLHFNFSNDRILQWVLRFVANIYKYLTTIVSHIWFMNKTLLKFIVDDLEGDYKIEITYEYKNN